MVTQLVKRRQDQIFQSERPAPDRTVEALALAERDGRYLAMSWA